MCAKESMDTSLISSAANSSALASAVSIPSSGAGGHLNAWHPLGLVLRVNGVRAGSSAKQISDPTRRWDMAGYSAHSIGQYFRPVIHSHPKF